jgi:shikimate 5-dehydrogenase
MAVLNQVRFFDGLYMLAAQGRRSFELWTGQTVPMYDYLRPLGL